MLEITNLEFGLRRKSRVNVPAANNVFASSGVDA
jgi:hypothetical protein